MTFDAALPWVYHEVYAWATSLGRRWMRRVLRPIDRGAIGWRSRSLRRRTILTRTTAGWAVARCRRHRRLAADRTTGATAGQRPGLVSGARRRRRAGINWVKFRHPYLFPLEEPGLDRARTRGAGRRSEATAARSPDRSSSRPRSSTTSAPTASGSSTTSRSSPCRPSPPGAPAARSSTRRYRTGSITAFMPLLFVAAACADSGPALTRPSPDARRCWSARRPGDPVA